MPIGVACVASFIRLTPFWLLIAFCTLALGTPRHQRNLLNQARVRAKPERAAGIHMLWRGFPPIFSKLGRPIRSGQVGKSLVGASEREVYKIFSIGEEI